MSGSGGGPTREPGDDTDEVVRELKDVMRLRWTRPQHRNAPVAAEDARETSWAELVELLSRFRRTKSKEDAGCWSPATFKSRAVIEREASCCGGKHTFEKRCDLRKNGTVGRKANNVEAVNVLVVDVDEGGSAARDAILERLTKRGVRHWWHTTHSAADRFRIIVPLSAPVPAARWWDVWHWATKALGARASADASCKDPCRLYYLPATALERDDDGAAGGVKSGRALDVEALYAQGAWPEQPRRTSEAAPRTFTPATETELWAAAQDLEKFGDAVEGKHGDTRTFVAGAILTHDWALTAEEAWPLFRVWNEKHAKPQWSDDELHEKLENSGAYAQGEYGKARTARTAYQLEVARVEAELAARLGNAVRTEPAKWMAVDDLLRQDFPAADWLVRGLLAKDTLTIIGADPKASKTWCLLELALAVGTGGKAFGEFPVGETAPVLLFLNEDTARSVRNRFRALVAGRGAVGSLSNIAVRTREPMDLGDRTQLAQLIVDIRMAPVRPALVGLDPLRNLHSAEENSSTEMREILRALGAIRELCGCALAVVHHSAKRGGENDGRTAGARMRGSSAIDGYRDGLISLEETEKGDAGDEITNQVVIDLKAFKGAGRFALTLKIQDDEQGEAVLAKWEKKEAVDRAKKKKRDEDPAAPKTVKMEDVAKKALEWFRGEQEVVDKTSGGPCWILESSAANALMDLYGSSKPTAMRALWWLVKEHKKLVREPVPMERNRGEGKRKRWQLRLADDAKQAEE